MPLEELAVPERVVGVSQVRRSMAAGRLRKLFAAKDADESLIRELLQEAERQAVPVELVESMALLGRACAIARGAAVAGLMGARDSQGR